jgi:rhodanese-related sulfurtransferase
MTPPSNEFKISGGCNCRALRYDISVPLFEARPQNPYRTPGAAAKGSNGDFRLPMVAIDHCNDCRRATGALLPMILVTDITWVRTICVTRAIESIKENEEITMPAIELFDFETVHEKDVYLNFYKSSPQRSRWFCSKCGTSLAYTVDDGVISPELGWPKMVDLWLGTVDREDLEVLGAPERMLWCEKGISWVQDFARNGSGGIPEHPTTKMDELMPEGEDVLKSHTTVQKDTSSTDNEPPLGSRSISETLEQARSCLSRISPQQAYSEYIHQSLTKPVILVDIRPTAQRAEMGSIIGSLTVERNVLEWRFDPQSDARLSVAGRYDLRIIVFCQEGYTSSLAGKALQELGLRNATDIDGGYRAWSQTGLPGKIAVVTAEGV